MAKEIKERKVRPSSVVLVVLFSIMAVLLIIPLYALVLGTFKGGAELFVSGLNLNPTPRVTR